MAKFEAPLYVILFIFVLFLFSQAQIFPFASCSQTSIYVEFEVLTAVIMKSIVIWDVIPYSPLEVNRRFGEAYRFHLQYRISRAIYHCESRIGCVYFFFYVYFLGSNIYGWFRC
jgi:hypothetical protein